MTHILKLQPKFFDFIKDGTKRIELRLFDEEFYTPEKQEEYGVLGIKIAKI